MRKIILQGCGIVILFFGLWFLLSRIDWVEILRVEKITDKTEEKLGDLFWETIKSTESENKNQFVVNSIDSIINKICKENNISRDIIKLHVINKDEVNAFALPNGHLVVYTGLLKNADKQEELCGVLGHEIAHITLNHVMKKLVSEIGLSVLISMTAGNTSGTVITETAKLLSSSAFDRSLEKDADIKSVDYLINAKINPEPFADFLYKIAGLENELTEYSAWLSTHPDSKERAEYIIEYSRGKKVTYQPVISTDTWIKLKEKLQD